MDFGFHSLAYFTGSKEFIGVVLVTDCKCYDREGKDLHNFFFVCLTVYARRFIEVT